MAGKKKKKGRSTVYNNITTPEKLEKVSPENLDLEEGFLAYLQSIGRSEGTVKQYRANLHVFWIWNLENNHNKSFIDLKKRELIKFQNHCSIEWGWSSKRLRTVKATLSSLSNYIENILDDEYEDYRGIVKKIESPADVPVRDKTVFSEKQLKKLLNTLVKNEEYMKACALSLAMNSARRKAEIPRFKVSYFNEDNLICEGALYMTPEKMLTKGGKMLDVYTLAKPFQPYLDLWMKQREEIGLKSDWLFPRFDRDGKCHPKEAISVYVLDSWANQFSEILGENFYWHSIRHFATTKLSEANLPESVIQDLIGWSSSDMVRLYVDTPKSATFEKYFGAEGIRDVKKVTLEEL